MRVNIFIISFTAIFSIATSDQKCQCSISHELRDFLRGHILKTVDASLQSGRLSCLDYLLNGVPSECTCDLKKWFSEMTSSNNCKEASENLENGNKRVLDANPANAVDWKKSLGQIGIDDQKACSELRKFNLLPLSSRSLEVAAKVFNSSGKYILFAWTKTTAEYQRSLEKNATKFKVAECFYDINERLAGTLYKVPPGYSLKCLYDTAECQKEELHIWNQNKG